MFTLDHLLRMNHTELYQVCKSAGIKCLPSDSRENMAGYLLGTLTPQVVTEGTHPIDSWRHGLSGFVRDHWWQIQSQVTCPLKSGDWRSCFGCLDTQVIECVVKNPVNEQYITLHRKTR